MSIFSATMDKVFHRAAATQPADRFPPQVSAPAAGPAQASPLAVDVEAVHAGADGSAEQNMALRKAVMRKLAENGGKVPPLEGLKIGWLEIHSSLSPAATVSCLLSGGRFLTLGGGQLRRLQAHCAEKRRRLSGSFWAQRSGAAGPL